VFTFPKFVLHRSAHLIGSLRGRKANKLMRSPKRVLRYGTPP